MDILSHLSVEEINDKVYSNINRLMDADVFGIGIYDAAKKRIIFPGIIEKGIKFSFAVNLDEVNRPAVWCVRRRDVFLVNSFSEYAKYNLKTPMPAAGEATPSVVYLPLIYKDELVGVFTVQSFKENAYSEKELGLLRELSVFIATAIHNARIHQSTEELVEQRSAELMRQKEELERSYERSRMLSEIGRKISGSLSVEEIVDDTYASVKQLMDAQIFGIAVINASSSDILDLQITEYDKKLLAKVDLKDPYRPGSVCFNEGRDVILNDFQNEIKAINPDYQKPLVGRPVGSVVYLPLIQKGRKIGVITVQHYEKNIFTPIDIEMLKTLSVHVSAALENALLYSNVEAEVQRRTEEILKQREEKELAYQHLKIVDEVGQEITATLDFEKIFEKLHSSVSQLMKADVFGVRLYHEERDEVEIKYEVWKGKRFDSRIFSMDNKNNFSVWCIHNRKEIFINDLQSEYKLYVDELVSLAGEHSHSLIFCPMMLGEKVLGVVTVQSYSKNQYTQQHLNIIKTLANYSAIALQNAEKYEQQQKLNKRLEESFRNIKVLSAIGQEITGTLNIEEVLDKVYVHVNELMDATEFGVGICIPGANMLDLCYYIFRGKRMEMTGENRCVSLDEKGRLSTVCVARREEIFINDFENEYKNFIPDLEAYKTDDDAFVLNSVMCLPLIVNNNVIGIITVQSEKKNAYSPLQHEMFKTLASYTAVALNNAESYHRLNESSARLEHSYRNIQLIGEIGKKITSTLQLEEILENVYEYITSMMDANEFGVGIYDEEKGEIDLGLIIYEGKRLDNRDQSFKISMADEGRLSVWCVKHQKEVFINDIENEYAHYIPNLDAYQSGNGLLLKSLICLPLSIEGKIIGNIFVQSVKRNAYSQLQLEMFRALAPYTAVALNNAEAYLKLNESTRQLNETLNNISILSEIGQKITATLDSDKVLRTVYENVNRLMDASMFVVFTYSLQTDDLNCRIMVDGGMDVDVSEKRISVDDVNSLCAKSAREREEIIISDYEKDISRYTESPISSSDSLPGSLVYIPLTIESRLIGVISVQSPKKYAYSWQHLEILRSLAAYTAIALDNAIAYERLDHALHEVEKLSVVASRTNNTVIIFNAETEIIWANKAFERNFGYELAEFKEIKGKTLLEISGRDDIAALVKECVGERRSVNYESENISRLGEKMWFQTTLTPVFDDIGNVRSIVAIDSDITEIKKAEELLWKKNQSITDSITYAKRIQNSILPADEKVQRLLPDSFVMNKPRDIVSGDFYWIDEIDNGNKIVIATVDCTGHGVPGAFLTIVGHSLLNYIVNERGVSHPPEIVRLMNEGLLLRLAGMNEDKVRDGMDMSVCLIDKSRQPNEVVFSGAFNPSFYVHNGSLRESIPIRQSIGFISPEQEKDIIFDRTMLNKGDMVYLFTDGYADQLGGERGKKFMKGRFRQLLNEIHELPVEEQQAELEKAMIKWKRNFGQTDDILVIGLRI